MSYLKNLILLLLTEIVFSSEVLDVSLFVNVGTFFLYLKTLFTTEKCFNLQY